MSDGKRAGFFAAILILCLGHPASPVPAAQSGGGAPLNVLLISVDTLRADRLSSYGYEKLQTRNMDRLAERGALFTRAFAHTPTTLPSHANMLLGTTPIVHGVHENAGFVVGAEFLTLAEFLGKRGYATGAFVGAFPLDRRFGLARGFDVYDDNYETAGSQKFAYGERKAGAVIDGALSWLKGRRAPWFLLIHVFDPHYPYEPPDPFRSRFKDDPYDGEIAYVDSELGRIFDHMETEDLHDRTLIILTSDHGESLGEHGEITHGFLAYNTTLWVPLIIAAPGVKPTRIDDFAAHIDIFPTVCDILRIRKPAGLDGVSLLPAMRGKRLPGRDIYFESLYPYFQRGWAPIRGLLSGKRKYIDSPIPELYDLEKDFKETNNLVGRVPVDDFRKRLVKMAGVRPEAVSDARPKSADRKVLETLASLGYLSGPPRELRKEFRPSDDVKILLPLYNRVTEAMDLHHAGRSTEAEQELKAVIAERSDLDIAHARLGMVYRDQGRMDDALEALRRGVEAVPESYEVFATYANTLLDSGRRREVMELVRRTNLRQMEYDPEIWNYLGLAAMQSGDHAAAEGAFRKALDIDSEYAAVYANLGTNSLQVWMRDKNPEAYEKSLGFFLRAIEIDPGNATAHNGLGAAYLQAGRMNDALASWRRALEFNPRHCEALYNLGVVSLRTGDKAGALSYLERYRQACASRLSPGEKQKLEDLIKQSR